MKRLIELAALPLCSLAVLMLLGSCSGVNGEQAVEEESVAEQPIEQEQDTTITPFEYARNAEAVDWAMLQLEDRPVWQRDIAHIGSVAPVIVESPDMSVVTVHSVDGVVGLSLQDGSQLWAHDLPVFQIARTPAFTVMAFTADGFAVEIDPIDGSIVHRFFHGHANQPSEWGTSAAYAEFSPAAVQVNRNSVALFRAVEASKDSAEQGPEKDVLKVADRHRFLIMPQDGDAIVGTVFGVEATGRYEVYGVNFEDVPAVFRVLSDSEDVLAENQEYGGMLDGFSVRLEAGKQYKISVQFLPAAPAETGLELMVSLLAAE